MLPKSSESASGAISVWQWVKMGWNYKSTPAFNPLQVFLLTFTCLPGIFDIIWRLGSQTANHLHYFLLS